MARKRLTLRGWYELPPAPSPDGSIIWKVFPTPPVEKSILIYQDGTVVEGANFDTRTTQSAEVRKYLVGGCIYEFDEDSFEYVALSEAGYHFVDVYADDEYAPDYDTRY